MSKKGSIKRMREALMLDLSYYKSEIKNNNFTKDEKINHSSCAFSLRQKDEWLYCILFKKYVEDDFGIFVERSCKFFVSKEELKKIPWRKVS